MITFVNRNNEYLMNSHGKNSASTNYKLECILKELRHGWRILKTLANFFKFAIRNPSLSSPSSTILVPVWFIITSLVFFYLSKLLFQGFLQFEGDSALRKNDLKYCDIRFSHGYKNIESGLTNRNSLVFCQWRNNSLVTLL